MANSRAFQLGCSHVHGLVTCDSYIAGQLQVSLYMTGFQHFSKALPKQLHH